MPVCDFPLERAAPCRVTGILPCPYSYNHSDTIWPNPAGAKLYFVVTRNRVLSVTNVSPTVSTCRKTLLDTKSVHMVIQAAVPLH